MKGFGFHNIITIVLYLRIIFCSEKPVMTLESDGEFLKAKKQVNESYGGLVIKGPGSEMIVECFSPEHALSKKLSDNFKNVKDGMPKFTCFYDYYDVLTIIDESIALTFKLINTVTDNSKKNKNTYEERKDKVEKNLENFNKLVQEVKTLSTDNPKEVAKELSELQENVDLYKDDLGYYNNFNIENYYVNVTERVNEIKRFRDELENLKKQICPLGELDIKNGPLNENDLKSNPDLFKKLRKYAFEIYDHLSKCQEKESKKLKFLFTFFNGILSEVEDYNKKLEGYKEKLGKPGV